MNEQLSMSNGWIGAGHSVSDFEIFYHDRLEKEIV